MMATTKGDRPFTNPVIPGMYPDPSICRNGDDYYLVNSTFAYTPGVPIFHSRDLVHWKQIGHCLTRPEQISFQEKDGSRATSYSRGIWAPTIRFHNGRFYMATHNHTTFKNFYVHTDDPAGEWSDPVYVTSPCIDPDLFFDPSGRVYWLVSCNHLMEIDIETGRVIGEMKQIWQGTGGRHIEGPHLYFRDGWYYIMQAEGGQWRHVETIARSRNIWGPYENCPHNPILNHNHPPHNPIQGVGHADMIEAHDGSWWMVFLGTRPAGDPDFQLHNLGRETFLAPVQWTDDGWPVVNKTGSVTPDMQAGLFAWNPLPETSVRDDFDKPALDFCWNHHFLPEAGNYSLTARPGWLRLHGSATSLGDRAAHTFLGRRQQHYNFTASTLLDFDPEAGNAEAGMTVFMDDTHRYEVAVGVVDGERRILVRRTVGTLSAVVAAEAITVNPVILEVHGEENAYTLGYRETEDDAFRPLAAGETSLLSTLIAGGCVGVYIGMYATGNGAESETPADFDWFDYEFSN